MALICFILLAVLTDLLIVIAAHVYVSRSITNQANASSGATVEQALHPLCPHFKAHDTKQSLRVLINIITKTRRLNEITFNLNLLQ